MERRIVEDGTALCITQHEGFESVCLNPHVLRVAYFAFRQEHGDWQHIEQHRYEGLFYKFISLVQSIFRKRKYT